MTRRMRLTLALDEPSARSLDRLVELTEATTVTEALRRSIMLYLRVAETQSGGGAMTLIDRHGRGREVWVL